MSSNQVGDQISGRIYGIMTNSISGSITIILFLLFLPVEWININRIPLYLINNDLITTPVLFIFVILSYIIGQMVQAYTDFVPLRSSISRVLYFFPLIPRFQREIVSEGYKKRFSWACDRLFYRFDGVERPSHVDLDYESLDLAQSYLKSKNISQVQIYEDISSSFAQLELLFTTSLLITLFILHPKNITPNSPQTSYLWIPAILFLLSISSHVLKILTDWISKQSSHRNLDDRRLTRKVNTNLLFQQLSLLMFAMSVISLLLLIVPFETNYNSNLKSLSGSYFRYTPFFFIILIYSSAYVEARYSKMQKITVISDLYTVAISEGDIIDEK